MTRSLISFLTALLIGISASPLRADDTSSESLARRSMERRAVEAVIWGMPAVNYDLMLQEMLTKTPGKVGQVIYWGRPLDWKNQTLTPNPDALYFMVFFNTKDGPVVLDLPPGDANGSFNGNIVTTWQMPLEDAGLLGYDRGKGGKYVVLPPGYKEQVADGFIPLQSDTFGGYMLFRSNLKSHNPDDVAASIAYGKGLKVYPLSNAAAPPTTIFTDVKDIYFDSTIRYDASFFGNLDRIVQREPWLDRDRAMIDQLRSLGIEKGKPFRPDEATTKALESGIREAHAVLEAKYDAGMPPFFSETSRWTLPAPPALIKAMQSGFSDVDSYPVDDRGMAYTYAFIGLKRLGAGQFYSISIRDKDGDSFDGAKTYRLTVPAGAPVHQYWSVTAYDRETHALVKGVDRASRASNASDVQKNADGSVDIYFGPEAPAGKEANWVPTDSARGFELMARFYGPRKEFFDKVWKLPDVEKVSAEQAQANYAFERGYPSGNAAQQARADADLQRAMIAYRFWYPTVSVEGIFNGNREKGIGDNQALAIMSAGPRQVAFTANSDTPYGAGVLDLSNGPIVVEMPPGPFIGLVDDHNQGWVLDMGLPGPDAGKGGKHLILPPGYAGEVPSGYYVGRSPTFKALIAVRSMPQDGNVDQAINALRKIRVYPLSTTSSPKLLEFIDISQQTMDGTSLRWEDNIQFWEKLHAIIQEEPPIDKFFPMYGLLAELGIEKGKPFTPDARMRSNLERAAKLARDQMLVSAFDSARPDRVNWPDRKWEWVSLTPGSAQFETPSGFDLESRDRWFAQAIVTSPAMFRRTAGAGSLYWLSARDSSDAFLDGGKTYKLSVPQPVPGKLFWSVTVYDAETRSQIQTDQDKAALRSMFELKDVKGSEPINLYFGPAAPAGQEARWIKTNPDKGWFAYFRIYGPEQAAFDRSWKPGDFEEVAVSDRGQAAEGVGSGQDKE
jgi:hypothetical protein